MLCSMKADTIETLETKELRSVVRGWWSNALLKEILSLVIETR
jgi:hypothetical protein